MQRLVVGLLTLALAGCGSFYALLPGHLSPSYEIRAGDLDSGAHPAHSILVSQLAAPDAASKSLPVAVLAHGFGATPYETSLIADQLHASGMLVSQVLLGGHGTSVEDFEKATWKTWEAPVIAEYRALRALGYTHVMIVGTSTGCPLWLDGIQSGQVTPVPSRIVMVSPMIEVSNKLMGYTGVLGWLGVKAKVLDATGTTMGNWYNNWPATAITSLLDLSEITKARLAAGITLPTATRVLVLQSEIDPTVDPRGAEMVREGLKGATVTVEMLKSTLHVPVRPDGIDGVNYTPDQAALRSKLLQEIATFLAS